MWEWLTSQDWSVETVSGLVAVLAAIIAAVVAMWREPTYRPWRWVGQWVGLPQRRYAKKFEDRWGRYENRYLKRENLDFRRTYIPITLERVGARSRPSASEILGDRDLRTITVIGEPGSGKSTLLRAYGIETLLRPRARDRVRSRSREVPFLVQLRRFAAANHRHGTSLADYVVKEALAADLSMSRPEATRLFDQALRRDRAVLLLDGLDEVPQARQDGVLRAVAEFHQNLDEDRPTGRARIILTCRQQNFTSLRETWEPVMKRNVYPAGRLDEESYQLATIAPLTEAEIGRYLHAVRSEFRNAHSGPGIFMQAVRVSGTMDLHRVPLVLSMSVGLYANKAAFDIPSEKARLYEQMVSEMLQRQAFRDRPDTGLLEFSDSDKRRFLREFAFANANGEPGCGESFGEFPRPALDRFAARIVAELGSVPQSKVADFVNEIIDRSGLLARVNGEDTFIFAHKSIQEHLVAEELRTRGEAGAELLLGHSDQTQWRHVFTFYVGTDQQSVAIADSFLTRLAERDLALAGSCVAAAVSSNEVADRILTALAEQILADERVLRADQVAGPTDQSPAERTAVEQRILVNLAALLDATQSLRKNVAGRAGELVHRVLEKIINLGAVFELLNTDLDHVARVIEALARSKNPAHIAAMAPKVTAAATIDARLVGPLWRCLAVPGMQDQPGAERIVERLLTLVMDRTCLRELQVQEQLSPDFATTELRRAVYPFGSGLPRDSNLVTLLCWAERLQTEPVLPNRYFQARREARPQFNSAEGDHRSTQRISPWRAGRILSGAGFVAASLTALYWLVTDPQLLTRSSSGLATAGWLFAPAFAFGTDRPSIPAGRRRAGHRTFRQRASPPAGPLPA